MREEGGKATDPSKGLDVMNVDVESEEKGEVPQRDDGRKETDGAAVPADERESEARPAEEDVTLEPEDDETEDDETDDEAADTEGSDAGDTLDD